MSSSPSEGSPGGAKGPNPLAYVSLGFELVAPMIVGVAGGYWLDRRFGTTPWLLVVGAFLGMAAGFLEFFRRVLPSKGRGGTDSSK